MAVLPSLFEILYSAIARRAARAPVNRLNLKLFVRIFFKTARIFKGATDFSCSSIDNYLIEKAGLIFKIGKKLVCALRIGGFNSPLETSCINDVFFNGSDERIIQSGRRSNLDMIIIGQGYKGV